eukprot:TRINITY_DN13405_c0_g1_i1.p1 TRINITY_DN13405_c0_g1~~TRINITY_DN13405_c0_g1_i1.p1  ORF type:complete len:260 (-),score=72.59 TRINITY_DN13405_c0_g1_i1:406-1185(-)
MAFQTQNHAFKTLPTEEDYAGLHTDLDPVMQTLDQATGLVRGESMQLSNDPRFFQGSILGKRLAAFSGLSVVSGLMVGTCSEVISMKKDMNLHEFDGQLQLLSLLLMSAVLYANVVATYIGVAQTYHTIRLETAGPTGFEMAASYYLNPNIVAWRHLAVKCMLNSLPLFMISTGLRMQVHFDRIAEPAARPSMGVARSLGCLFMTLYILMGCCLYYLHSKHMAIFRERYDVVVDVEAPYRKHVSTLMHSNGRRRGPLDV